MSIVGRFWLEEYVMHKGFWIGIRKFGRAFGLESLGSRSSRFILYLNFAVLALCRILAQDLNQSIQSVAGNLRSDAVAKEEARLLKVRFGQDDLAIGLLESLWKADCISVEDASKRLLLEMDPFPFEQVSEILAETDSPLKQAYLLSILSRAAKGPEQIAVILEAAKSKLGNKGKGIRRYGEAKAYSAEGLRVCDVAYNILVTRLPLVPSMPRVDVDNFSADKRDALIVELAKRESILLQTDARMDMTTAPDERRDSPSLPERITLEEKQESNPVAPSDEPRNPKSWVLFVVLGLVMFIVLCLLYKRRASVR